MGNRLFLVVGLAAATADVGFGQDYIRSVFGLGKKAPPKKTESPIIKEGAVTQIPSEYLLTPKNGPFHIFVASYVGDRGVEYALRLATELRTKHGLDAYVHNYRERDDFLRPDAKQMEEMKKRFMGSTPRFPQFKNPPQDHWGVVVGNFAGIENDRAFDATMKKLKRLTRDSFSQPVMVELRWGTDANGKNPNELVGLRGTANPLRPKDEKLTDEQLKSLKLIKEMNDPEPYSVYQLKAPYTLCVFKFSSGVGIAKNEKKGFFSGGEKQTKGLAMAADNARIFCKLMRDMGYEAYIFHSDIASVVCVNGYQGRNDPKWIEDYKKFSKMKILGIQLEPDLILAARDPASVLSAN
jgi:hypothetical protein